MVSSIRVVDHARDTSIFPQQGASGCADSRSPLRAGAATERSGVALVLQGLGKGFGAEPCVKDLHDSIVGFMFGLIRGLKDGKLFCFLVITLGQHLVAGRTEDEAGRLYENR